MIKARKSIARTVRFVILKLKLSIWGRTEAGTWANRGYSSPAPRKVKLNVLARYSRVGDTWIETGTLTGETTAYLAKRSDQVFSIEPSPHFADRARKRFINSTNVTILEGLSEDHIGSVLSGLTGDVSFWLDGHYSGGDTYQGPLDTPIREELNEISQMLDQLNSVSVFVDDIRCFDPSSQEYSQYPSRNWLAQWADQNGLNWTIEHDIFIAYK